MSDPIKIGPVLVEVGLDRQPDRSVVTLLAWMSGDFLGEWELTFEREESIRLADIEHYGGDDAE